MSKKIALISLGCAKNLVNSEQMLYLLNEAEYILVDAPEQADAVIINTCGFIDAAKEEAIDTILSTAEIKKENPDLKIIVTGCLTERYKEEVMSEIPEIDAITGVGSYSKIVDIVEEAFRDEKPEVFDNINAPVENTPRIISTGPSWAYLRIAEGCNNFCAFCAIPYIRGRYRSRNMEEILEEARSLADQGVKEIIVIAQDITRYGIDLYGSPSLAKLCHQLSEIEGIRWIRLHYLYPENRGIAFGMFQGNVQIFAVISVLIVSLMIVLWVRTPRTKRYLPFRLACVLLISGAVGNLIDRVFRGFVIDFIYFEPIDFPLFNLADCFVVISAFLIAALLIFVYKEDEDLAFLSRQKPKGD